MGNTRFEVGKRYLIAGSQRATAVAETDKFPIPSMGFSLDEEDKGGYFIPYIQDKDGLYYFTDDSCINLLSNESDS